MKSTIIVALSALAVATPALAARQVITPSGQPDAMFDANVSDTMAKLTNGCMNKGWSVESQTPNQLVCAIPMGAFQSAMAQMLIGNSYSTAPKSLARFSVAQVGGATSRVQAAAWIETTMAFGQTRSSPLNGDNQLDGLEGFMLSVGGKLPPGTRIPGSYSGFDGVAVQNGRDVYIPVTKVFPHSPAEDAGLQVGDKVWTVNGSTFKNDVDYHAKMMKIATGNQYAVEIERNGARQTVTMVAKERPVVGTPEWDELQKAQAASATGG